MRWFRAWFGRDWMHGEGFGLGAHLIERVDLMVRADEGRMILVGLGLAITVRSPWGLRGPRAWISYGDRHGWRAPFSVRFRSDADEIARRLAA